MNNKTIYTIVAIIIILVAALIIKFGGSKENTQTMQETNQVAKQGCEDTTDRRDSNGRFVPSIDVNKKVLLETSMGNITMELYGKDAPKTSQNFLCLVQKGYYDGITFHRVAHNFVIQAGDPTGTGSGGESAFGPTFEDELYSDTASYKAGYLKGVVAMANRGPSTNSSQFFIMVQNVDLPNNYTIFGKVVEGLDIVEKIGAVPVNAMLGPEDGSPKTPVIIKKATVK